MNFTLMLKKRVRRLVPCQGCRMKNFGSSYGGIKYGRKFMKNSKKKVLLGESQFATHFRNFRSGARKYSFFSLHKTQHDKHAFSNITVKLAEPNEGLNVFR